MTLYWCVAVYTWSRSTYLLGTDIESTSGTETSTYSLLEYSLGLGTAGTTEGVVEIELAADTTSDSSATYLVSGT